MVYNNFNTFINVDKNYNVKEIIEYHIAKSGKQKKQIAKLAGMNAGSFNKMLSNPTARTLKSLADALGIKPYELLQTEADEQDTGVPKQQVHSVIIDGIEYIPKT